MSILEGKKALILGIASKKSIAWGIAKAMKREGAEIGLTYQTERFKDRVKGFAEELSATFTLECDVDHDDSIGETFSTLERKWGRFDILVHSIAYAPRELLQGGYLDNLDREGFRIAHETSAYSFAALAKSAKSLMNEKGAMLTLSYIGAMKAMPSYNIMGPAKASLEANVKYIASQLGPDNIRVNAISAGPIRTLAASGVKDLRRFLEYVEKTSPLRRNITIEEVGNTASFLCSDLASGITGEITYVDCGYNITGMTQL